MKKNEEKMKKMSFAKNMKNAFLNKDGIFEQEKKVSKMPEIKPVTPLTEKEKEIIRMAKEKAQAISLSLQEIISYSYDAAERNIDFIIQDPSKIDPHTYNTRMMVLQDVHDKEKFVKIVMRTLKSQFCNITKSQLIEECEKIYENVMFYRNLYLCLLGINTCYVKKSPIHGNGVFATRNLKKGDIVTFFFPYFLETVVKSQNHDILDNPEEGVSILPIVSRRTLNSYNIAQMRNCENCVMENVYLMGDQLETSDPRFLGHMVNDACTFFSGITELEYDEQISQRVNSCIVKNVHEPRLLYVIACKDIAKDEEILTYYTWAYWQNTGIPQRVEPSVAECNELGMFSPF